MCSVYFFSVSPLMEKLACATEVELFHHQFNGSNLVMKMAPVEKKKWDTGSLFL